MNNNKLNKGDWVKIINPKSSFYNEVFQIQDLILNKNMPYFLTNLVNYADSELQKIISIDQLLPFKVDCGNVETSKKIQNILGAFGYKCIATEATLLYIHNNKKITYELDSFKDCFIDHIYQQIPVELLLWLEEQNNKNKNSSNDKDSLDALSYVLHSVSNKPNKYAAEFIAKLASIPLENVSCKWDFKQEYSLKELAKLNVKNDFLDFIYAYKEQTEHNPIDFDLDKQLNEIEKEVTPNKTKIIDIKDIKLKAIQIKLDTVRYNYTRGLYLDQNGNIINGDNILYRSYQVNKKLAILNEYIKHLEKENEELKKGVKK